MTSAPPILDTISLESLPSMPAAALTIVRLCDDPTVGLEELAAAVSLDPVLSARILRMANSAAYSRGTDITSLDVAMMLMGTKVVKITALGFSLGGMVSEQIPSSSEIGSQMWRRCLVKAIACRELAGLAQLRSAPEAFLMGLFDGMGQMLSCFVRPEEYRSMIAVDPWPSAEVEREHLGFAVTELVHSALASWGVPELYTDALGLTREPIGTTDRSESGDLAAVLVLGRHATRLLLGGGHGDFHDADAATAALGLDHEVVDTIAATLGVHLNDLAATLDVDLGAEVDYQAVLNSARAQLIFTSLQMAEESVQQTEQIQTLESEHESLRRDATTDRLTGLPNRAAFESMMTDAVSRDPGGRNARGERIENESLAIAMIDIDHFKKVNDTYGHRAGDDVLVAVGGALRSVTRRKESIARYGGEEFVLIANGLDGLGTLESVCERIRREVEALSVDCEGVTLTVTVSVGAVLTDGPVDERIGGEMIAAADRLLYEAKRGGRNAVAIDRFG